MTESFLRYNPTGYVNGRPIVGSTKAILESAYLAGITYHQLPGSDIFELRLGDHIEYFFDQIPPSTTALGFYILGDKRVTNNILREADVSVPQGYCIYPHDSLEYIREVFNTLNKPLVVKTTHGNQGIGVFTSITTEAGVIESVNKAFECSTHERKGALVEEMFDGKEYRILATKDRVIAVLHRVPAHVIGDGTHTIEELISIKNTDPRRKPPEQHGALATIATDDALVEYIKDTGWELTSIPKQNEHIRLRPVSNISQGGDSIDFTDIVHPSIKAIALKVMNALPGVNWAGIDLMTRDITQEQTDSDYCIIEVNSSPGLDIHDEPCVGENRHAARAFIEELFPELNQ